MAKHERTLAAIFAEPTRANIDWADIEALFVHLGAAVQESRGSRVNVTFNGERTVFHRPHPRNEDSKPLVRAARQFLHKAGRKP